MNELNQLFLVDSQPYSLDQWLLVNPLSFSIPPNGSQTIRMAFRPQADTVEGEYKTMLYFNQVIIDDKPGIKQLKSKLKIGAAVYMQIGNKLQNAKITSAKIENGKPFVVIENIGNAHVRFKGNWSLWHNEPNKAVVKSEKAKEDSSFVHQAVLPTTPVLPGHTRKLVLDWNSIDLHVTKSLFLVLDGFIGDDEIFQVFPLHAFTSNK